MGSPKASLAPFVFEDDGEHPHFVSAASRALAILRAFDGSAQFLGNLAISGRTGLPKPTVTRLTFTLTRLGFLHYSPSRQAYAPAPAMLNLGHQFLRSHPVVAVAQPLMDALARRFGAMVALGAPDGLRMLLLACACACDDPAFDLGDRLGPGARVPHGLTALGRADLAARPEDVYRRELVELRHDCAAADWPRVRASIEAARAEVAACGYCLSLGDWRPGLYAVGVPLVSRDGERIVSFSCSGPATAMTRERLRDEVGPALRALRDAVATRCGATF